MVIKYISQLRPHSSFLALSTIAIGVPIVAVLASKLVFWPAIIAIVILLLDKNFPETLHRTLKSRIGLSLLGMVIWGGLSCIWSLNPAHSFVGVLRFLLISGAIAILVSCALVLNDLHKHELRIWMRRAGWMSLVLAFLIVGSVWGFTSLTNGWGEKVILYERLNYFNRTAAVLLAMSWPISAAVARLSGPLEQWAYLLMIGVLCYLLPSSALFVAFFFGIFTFAVAHASLRMAKIMLLVSFIGYILLIPFLGIIAAELTTSLSTLISSPTSEIHRIKVWAFALEKIFENPLLGYGFDISNQVPGGNSAVVLHTMATGEEIVGPLMPLHPHSAPIQVWLELGTLGLCLFTTFLYLSVSSISSRKSQVTHSAAATATLASCFIMAILSFDLWQGWWLFTLCSTAVLNVAIGTNYEASLETNSPEKES